MAGVLYVSDQHIWFYILGYSLVKWRQKSPKLNRIYLNKLFERDEISFIIDVI